MAINPVSLPTAAGIEYSGGDVRHISLGDAVDVPGLSTPTRHLAERDNLLAETLNEVVAAVNNNEQMIPLPVIRTMVPPGEQIVVLNYRIPAGFEARVLNAAVSTSTGNPSVSLAVYYSASFGASTGTAVVTCAPGSEFGGGVSFSQTGEFIVAITNTGVTTQEIIASVTLTMRPLGATGSLLVGTVIAGPQGQPGQAGPPGPPGPAGGSGVGTPGMTWQGEWTVGNSYVPNDVVNYSYSGTNGSWICRVSNTAALGSNDPSVDPVTWNVVALGTSSSGTVISFVTTSGSIPNYQTHTVYGTLTTGSNWTNVPLTGFYPAAFSPSTVYNTIPMTETVVQSAFANPGYGKGLASLHAFLAVDFTGSALFTLPKNAYGAAVDYTNYYVGAIPAVNGTIPFSGSIMNTVSVVQTSSDSFLITNWNSAPLATQITFLGIQTF